MADIFFSYSRKDKERVGLVRNALSEMGFEVFWDQETPSGSDWDTWIRAELAKSKCAVVFWSATSTVSDNVRHEAVVAKEQRKLISVFLDQLPARDLPMGFYSQQAADLSKWNGDQEDTEWRKFRREFEAKLMPRWVQQKLNDVDAELEGERAKRQTAEAHEKSLRTRISTEAKIQQDLKRERDNALTEVGELRASVEERDKALQAQTAKQADTEQGLKTERDRAFAELAKLTATVEGLSRARPDAGPGEQTKRWLSPIAVGIVLLAAIAGAFVSLSVRKTDGEAGAKFAELTATVIKSDKSRQDAEAKADQTAAALAKSEQARQAAEANAADADKARQAALAKADDSEKARQAAATKTEDVDRARQTAEAKAADAERARQAALARAADAEKARQAAEAKAGDLLDAASKAAQARQAAEVHAAEADKARQAAEAKAAGIAPNSSASPSTQFSRRSNMEANGAKASPWIGSDTSIVGCEQNCAQSNTCKVYTYNKKAGSCYMYSIADLSPNENYDSGIRQQAVAGDADLHGFNISPETEAVGSNMSTRMFPSMNECLQACANVPSCRAFTYLTVVLPGTCYLYSSATFTSRPGYISGRR